MINVHTMCNRFAEIINTSTDACLITTIIIYPILWIMVTISSHKTEIGF